MELALALVVVFVAQMVKGITGFGAALVALPPLTVLFGPAEAILLSSACDLISGGALLVEVRAQVRWKMILPMFLALAVGLQVGATLLDALPREVLLVAMGTIVAAMGTQFALQPVRPGFGELGDLEHIPPGFLAQAVASGFLSGVSGGSIGVTGPPLVLWARRWLTDRFFRVQVIALLFLAGFALPTTLLVRGLVPPEALAILPWLLLPLVGGMRTGAWLAPRLSRVAFGRTVGVILVASGLMLLGRAVTSVAW